MGCTVLGAVILPLWLIVSSSALYLVPGLGGDWMLDPATGDISFQYHALPVLVFRGGLVGGVLLAMGTPLVSLGFLLFSTATAMGRRIDRIEAAELGDRAGPAELSAELIVRKRSSVGRTADAIPITEASASGLRRLLARGLDLGLLVLSVAGAVAFGAMLHQADLLAMVPWTLLIVFAGTGGVLYRLACTLLLEAGLSTPGGFVARITGGSRSLGILLDRVATAIATGAGSVAGILGAKAVHGIVESGLVPTSLLLGSVSAASFFLVQWLAVSERGQTLGKLLFDIRLAGRDQDRPSWVRGVLVRTIAFDVLDAALALAIAVPAAAQITRWIGQTEYGVLFVLPSLRLVLATIFWSTAIAALPTIRSLTLLFAVPLSLHDWIAGTRVVRTAVIAEAPDSVPLGHRIVARLIDSLLFTLAAGLPISAELVRITVLDGQVGWFTAITLVVSGLLGLAVLATQWLQLVSRGDTVGKRVLGIEVVALEGERNAMNLVVVREWLALGGLTLTLGVLGLFLDALFALSEDRRAIHDHLAGTRVRWRP